MKKDFRLHESIFKRIVIRGVLITAVMMVLGVILNYNPSLIFADHDKDEQAEHEGRHEKLEHKAKKGEEEDKYDEKQTSYPLLSQEDYTNPNDVAVTLQVDTHDPVKLTGFIQDNIVYLPAKTVLEQFNISYVWYENIDAFELFIPVKEASGKVRDCILRSEQNVIFVDGNKYKIGATPLMKGKQLYVSAETLALLMNYQMTSEMQAGGWLLTWEGVN
ncbi:hypothetical protein M6D81_29870 [Paenibacillus sp. J5C_2022]|uniref:stalk domain-containing protein n=1 Tax=Paenibacillus sp. J5C2022 TaxID=2977129 RepID=UPI0021CE8B12|nr:hypothetical protein [Paenibacillus sp. J5C2022]MCU6712918.1 hypothetical protein [Paenibacillus sp. J5C2022]